jgi:serine/threonine-protein kinase
MTQENLVGRTVADYRLLKRVGEGGTATVYRAEHSDRGNCAVKILKPRLRADENARKRFLRESEYGGRVQHDAVVRTFDYGEADGLIYLALEWADGEVLSDFIERTGRLQPDVVANMVTQLAGALGAAHASDIIHRDLKPENIVYNPETQAVKLLDFGIARDAQADPAQRLTRTGFFVGTLQYVAPEALSGELVGPSADIYSLATIAYHLLTGVHPYEGRSPRELFQQLLTAEAKPLSQAVKGVKFPARLERAIMHGLQRDPKDRPATVEEFAEGVARAGEAGAAPDEADGGGLLGAFKSMLKRK